MPVYAFECPNCGHKTTMILPISRRNDGPLCHPCGQPMLRDWRAEHVNSANQEYDQPLLSRAFGINPAQIPEAKRQFPHHEYAPDGRLVIRSHAELRRVMRDLGAGDWGLDK